MILHLGGDIDVEGGDIVAVLSLGEGGAAEGLLTDARQARRVLAGEETRARSVILCAGARRPGGVTENARLYLSPVAAGRIAARAESRLRRFGRRTGSEIRQIERL